MKRLFDKFKNIVGEGQGTWVRPCTQEVTTASGTHPCKERGEHYQHACVDPDCGFRWAA